MSESIKEAKLATISSHIKSAKEDRYRAYVSLITERALSTQYPEIIASLEEDIKKYSNQIVALEAQYASIESE